MVYYLVFSFSVPVVLVGNKTDLHQERAVPTEEGRQLAESWKAKFLETSAKQNEVSASRSCDVRQIFNAYLPCFWFHTVGNWHFLTTVESNRTGKLQYDWKEQLQNIVNILPLYSIAPKILSEACGVRSTTTTKGDNFVVVTEG